MSQKISSTFPSSANHRAGHPASEAGPAGGVRPLTGGLHRLARGPPGGRRQRGVPVSLTIYCTGRYTCQLTHNANYFFPVQGPQLPGPSDRLDGLLGRRLPPVGGVGHAGPGERPVRRALLRHLRPRLLLLCPQGTLVPQKYILMSSAIPTMYS